MSTSITMDKTPVSRLNEICDRNSIKPEYQLLSVEGVVHKPTFVFRLSVAKFVTSATGASKKKAKQIVAREMIKKLVKESDFIFDAEKDELGEYLDVIDSLDDFSRKEVKSSESKNELNPVGKLQEVCIKRCWRPPHYETIGEEGLPHVRVFRVECFLENMNFVETGTGGSKRLAKRSAACNMLRRLGDENLADDTEDLNSKRKSVYTPNIDDLFQKFNTSKIKSGLEKIDNFYSNLVKRSDKKDAIEAIVSDCLNSVEIDYDAIAAFTKLAHLLNCTVKFSILPELNVSNDYQSLVQMFSHKEKFSPILTAWGTGQTTQEAKLSAAFRAFAVFNITHSTYN